MLPLLLNKPPPKPWPAPLPLATLPVKVLLVMTALPPSMKMAPPFAIPAGSAAPPAGATLGVVACQRAGEDIERSLGVDGAFQTGAAASDPTAGPLSSSSGKRQ